MIIPLSALLHLLKKHPYGLRQRISWSLFSQRYVRENNAPTTTEVTPSTPSIEKPNETQTIINEEISDGELVDITQQNITNTIIEESIENENQEILVDDVTDTNIDLESVNEDLVDNVTQIDEDNTGECDQISNDLDDIVSLLKSRIKLKKINAQRAARTKELVQRWRGDHSFDINANDFDICANYNQNANIRSCLVRARKQYQDELQSLLLEDFKAFAIEKMNRYYQDQELTEEESSCIQNVKNLSI